VHEVVQALILGILVVGIYALMASGLTLVFGIMKVINVAQGALVILAAYLSYALWSHLGVELIVVCGDGETWEPAIAEIPDGIRVIYGPADATQSQLRSLGLASAIGDLVMLVDDPATARDEWLEHLRGAGRQTESPRA